MDHLIPAAAIERYSAAPSPSTVTSVKSLHENIRSILGSQYDTFLQGSYKNDTGVASINDVDIVALRAGTRSTLFNPGMIADSSITWEEIFQEVQDALEGTYAYRGKTVRGDKCITVNTTFKADVVPAIQISADGTDPISIYSFRQGTERMNYPRVHYTNNVNKNARTGGLYKPVVRMFKQWVRNLFPGTNVAPSYYVECLVYNVPDVRFLADLAWAFYSVAHYIVNEVTTGTVVNSVAGDKDILVSTEWDAARFLKFQAKLSSVTGKVAQALGATNEADARMYWRGAFNE
jgi:hypothetical protein